MELKEIKAVIDLMTRNDLTEFELERGDVKIRIKRGQTGVSQIETVGTSGNGGNGLVAAPAAVAVTAAPAPVAAAPAADIREIKSPMVGTFYRAPSPETPPYVEIGQAVTEETVVCLIEAMKVMNEIKAEVRGVITEVLLENAKPVEFGKPLFRVKAG